MSSFILTNLKMKLCSIGRKDVIHMSFADEDKKDDLPGFAKKAELAKDGTRFCVTSVREVTKDNKTAWFLDILLSNGAEQVAKTVTFEQAPPDKFPSKRDKKLQVMRDDDLARTNAVHGVWIASSKTQTGSTYFNPRSDAEFVCLCSQTAGDESEDDEAYD